tara:strand:- start:675 stop:1823 length:1149 start_codon:yes stop_codon:yes gene_type:complete
MIKKCRVCANPLFEEPLLEYQNMPGAAQYMPSQDEFKDDRGVDLNICQCSGCGLVQLNNQPVPYYREVIRATSFSEEMTAFRREQFKNFLGDYKLEKKKIIEVGCGTGHYLSILSEFEVDVRGIEYSPNAVKTCRANGLNVEKGFIEHRTSRLRAAPFDAFLIMSFLEHLPEPNESLGGIYNNLADNGVGLVEVPNFDMIMENNLFAEFIGDHLFYFTEATLKRTLETNGFDVLDCQPVWHDYILSAVVKKQAILDLSRFRIHKEKLKKKIENYLNRFPENTVAIWGAGHQSLAIISLLDLGDKIRYVVDSATFKQGKFTPATNIPIKAPDILNEDPVDAIIVMAASYSEEVVSILKEYYSPDINIATLGDLGLEIINQKNN